MNYEALAPALAQARSACEDVIAQAGMTTLDYTRAFHLLHYTLTYVLRDGLEPLDAAAKAWTINLGESLWNTNKV